MKKTVLLSLVAGAIIFAGCGGGGGGGSTSGGTTSGGTTSGGTTSGGTTSGGTTSGGTTSGGTTSGGTYTSYPYPATELDTQGLITVNNADKTWTITVNNAIGVAGASVADQTYAQAEKFCADRNQTLPSPKDLLTTALRPNDGTSAAWAKGKFVAYFGNDNVIGQSSSTEANEQRKVICLNGKSIEKKHTVNDIAVSIAEHNATTQLTGVKDVTTGLSWTPVHTYDKDIVNPGHANESRFAMVGSVAPSVTAAGYCAKYGQGWRLPTLAELRTITYLDGTTGLKDPETLKPTVLWTNTPGATAGTHYAIHLNPNNDNTQPYYAESPESDADEYFVTCVK